MEMNVRLVGAHGTGKSTMLNSFAAMHPEVKIWEGKSRNLRKLLRDELDMQVSEKTIQSVFNDTAIAAQKHQPGHGEAGINLHTRSIFDNWAYSKAYGWDDLADEYEKHIPEMYDESDIFVYLPISFEILGDQFRPADPVFQRRVGDFLLEILDRSNVPYYTLDKLENRLQDFEKIVYGRS